METTINLLLLTCVLAIVATFVVGIARAMRRS